MGICSIERLVPLPLGASKTEVLPDPFAPQKRFTAPNSNCLFVGNSRNAFRSNDLRNGGFFTRGMEDAAGVVVAFCPKAASISSSRRGSDSTFKIARSKFAAASRFVQVFKILGPAGLLIGRTEGGEIAESSSCSVMTNFRAYLRSRSISSLVF